MSKVRCGVGLVKCGVAALVHIVAYHFIHLSLNYSFFRIRTEKAVISSLPGESSRKFIPPNRRETDLVFGRDRNCRIR